MKKKALAMILALCMVLSMLPATVFAAQPQEQLSGMMVPGTVGELEAASIEPNAKSYSISLTSEGSGDVELLVDSPAKAGSEVYFLADPDDGYLAEIYYSGLEDDDLVYVGADVFGFIMPSNKVTLKVKFVAAEGSSHSIDVYEVGGSGDYALSRSSAKEYESVLLAVQPSNNDNFDPTGYVWVSGAAAYYLFEDSGVHYYEIFMGSENVKIFLSYKRTGPYTVSTWFDVGENGGTVQVSPEKAYVNDLVTVTIKPNPGYELTHARAVSYAGDIITELEPIGNDQYTFRMHPSGVELHVAFEAIPYNVTVTAGPNGTATANVSQATVGETVTVTCSPADGYKVASITGVDGLTEEAENRYSFTMPARDASIKVTFKKIYEPITVTVETGLGGTAVTDVAEAKAGDIVTLTCTPEEGYRVAQITGVSYTDNGDNTYTFTMPDKAVAIKVLFLRENNPFLDVNETHFFYDPVLWAVENGITNGIDATHFGPYLETNRASVVTMLWRYAGSPAPETDVNPFTDVPEGSWYYNAVLWAVEKGITNGINATTFGPALPCNRAQVVTFLWRFLNQPEPSLTEHPFTDVEAGSWYEAPVLWALENGITTGATATTFAPEGQCLRAHFVTFLYRTAQLPVVYDLHWVINGFQDTPSDYGTVTLSHTAAEAGETITATVIPAEGWQIDWVKCEFGTEITQVSDTEYTFVMPEHEEIFHVNFVEIPEEPDPTEPEPTEPDPTEPAVTYSLILKDNGYGKVSYVDVDAAAPGESIFFYAVPNEGYYLARVGIFDPYGEIDVSALQLFEHGNDLYELIMIEHEVILTCYFEPIPAE